MKKNFIYTLLTLLITGILPFTGMAQPYVDLLNLKMQYFTPQSIGSDGNSTLTEKQYEGSFLLPMEQKNKDVIMIGGNMYHLDFNTAGSQSLTSGVTSASLDLGYQKMWNPKWQTLFMAIPKINGQQLEFSGNDMQMGGIVLFTYTKADNLKYDIGAYYNQEFFGGYFIPLVGINWKASEHITVFGDLPANFNFEYKFNSHVYAGVSFLSIISSYRMNDMPGGSDLYVRDGNKTFGHDEIKAYINYYLAKNIVWYAECGQTMGRDYQLYNESDQEVANNIIYQPYHNGMFVNMGLAVRFRLDDDIK